jgi:hypothetical protein
VSAQSLTIGLGTAIVASNFTTNLTRRRAPAPAVGSLHKLCETQRQRRWALRIAGP